MVFGFFEGHRFLGRPVWLLQLTVGTSAAYYFTNADRDITFQGQLYNSTPMRIPAIRATQSTDAAEVDIGVPAEGPIGSLFSFFPPSAVVDAELRQGHLGDPDNEFVVIFSGRVLAATRQGAVINLKLGSLLRSLKRVGLTRHYQLNCPWALYGPNCKASQVGKKTTATLNAVSPVTITLDAGQLPYPDGKYIGGEVRWTDADGSPEVRGIIAVPNPNEFLLTGPTRNLVAGMTVDMYVGCAHNTDDCANLHNNILNYGGQPGLPLKGVVMKNNHW